MDIKEVRRLNGLQLAYVGDSVYDLFVRKDILECHDESVQKLHKRAISRVNAGAQARAFDLIEGLLNEEEHDVARRGSNAHFAGRACLGTVYRRPCRLFHLAVFGGVRAVLLVVGAVGTGHG